MPDQSPESPPAPQSIAAGCICLFAGSMLGFMVPLVYHQLFPSEVMNLTGNIGRMAFLVESVFGVLIGGLVGLLIGPTLLQRLNAAQETTQEPKEKSRKVKGAKRKKR